MSNHSFKILSEATTVEELTKELSGSDMPFEVIRNTAAQILNSGARFLILEKSYLDRDFSDLYSNYYSRLFQQFPRACKRYHFFKRDLTDILSRGDSAEIIQSLEDTSSAGDYIGFVVIRPTLHAPLARAVLKMAPGANDAVAHVLVKSGYKAHLFGAELEIEGIPLTQQDSRVGACAQASIWMAARHFTEKHGNVWASMADITRHATKQADLTTSNQLPAGASFLNGNNMIRAISAIDRKPLSYTATPVRDPATNTLTYTWSSLAPTHAVINRYVDSGIPVILGFGSWTGGSVGHAVLAVGHVQSRISEMDFQKSNIEKPTRSIFCSHFLINDDQRGAYRYVPIAESTTPELETPFNLKDHLQYIIVPLPDKVFLTGEEAETIAWDTLENYYLPMHNDYAAKVGFGPLAEIGTEIAGRYNDVIARTYLTYGWKYKKRLLCGDTTAKVKAEILDMRLPKYVWVTEFGFFQDLNHLNGDERSIFGHFVADATTSRNNPCRLFFHAPGFMAIWQQNQTGHTSQFDRELFILDSHTNYRPKIRGQ
ncbi:hypothetical protein [Kordiimonas sp.]|uniref:hypothetical protein n=1 Tax=Kordiimonas sp. TaxID=1970157 RepID=UPI003A8FCF12